MKVSELISTLKLQTINLLAVVLGEGFRAYLDAQIANHQPSIQSVQMVLRENLMKFQGNQKSPYLKITVTDPKFINRLRSKLEDGSYKVSGRY